MLGNIRERKTRKQVKATIQKNGFVRYLSGLIPKRESAKEKRLYSTEQKRKRRKKY